MPDQPISPNQTIGAFQTTSTGKVHGLAQTKTPTATYARPACADEYVVGMALSISADQVDCLKCRKALGLV